MRLTCPNCGAQYEVADDVVPDTGRDVQCSNCGHVWFEKPGGYDEVEPEPEHPTHVETDPEHEPDAVVGDMDPDTPADDDFDDDDDDDDDSLFDDDLIEEEAAAEDDGVRDEDDERPEESPAPEEPPQTAAAMSPGLDPDVEDILRTEAARERAARQGAAIESQEELGLDSAGPAAERARRRGEAARNLARLRGEEEATVIGGPISAPTAEGARRDRLPDIEEINTTLESGSDRGAAAPDTEKDRQARGFRYGFGLVTLVMAALALLYLGADEIGDALPQLEPTMTAYQDAVDQARLWLDLKVQSLIAGSGPGVGTASE